MIMYKLGANDYLGRPSQCVIRTTDGACIPFDPANSDFANFKKEVLAGAELQDADGNVMTQEQANQFVGSLA